jgi:putative transposase
VVKAPRVPHSRSHGLLEPVARSGGDVCAQGIWRRGRNGSVVLQSLASTDAIIRASESDEDGHGESEHLIDGGKVTELCRRHGISDAIFYTWRSEYGGLEISEMCRLRQREKENRRLKSILANQALDIRALKDVLAKNGYGPR